MAKIRVFNNGAYETVDAEEALPYIEETPAPPTAEDRIAALEEQNEMLLECLLEMSEIIYA